MGLGPETDQRRTSGGRVEGQGETCSVDGGCKNSLSEKHKSNPYKHTTPN